MPLPRLCEICGTRFQPRTWYNKLCPKCEHTTKGGSRKKK